MTEPSATPSSAKTALHPVTNDKIEECWPLIEKSIAAALSRDGLYGPEHVKEWVLRGTHQLWIAGSRERGIEALAVTEMLRHPNGQVINFWLCTGTDRVRWIEHKNGIEEWAKGQGCTRSVAHARKGWAKALPDYKLTHVVLEKML